MRIEGVKKESHTGRGRGSLAAYPHLIPAADLLTPWSQPLLLDATIHNTKFLFDLLFIMSVASTEQRKVCPLHLGRGAGWPGAVVLLSYANGCASQMASNARSSWKGLYGTSPIIEATGWLQLAVM
ncbi:hypothetical protein ACQJBY_009542 [Aegilops geniculata]